MKKITDIITDALTTVFTVSLLGLVIIAIWWAIRWLVIH